MPKMPTTQDLLEAINESFSHLEATMVTKDYLEKRLEARFAQQETNLVTKEYLDEKMGDLYGKFFDAMRKVNCKVTTTVDELVKYDSLNKISAKKILAMEPFPQAIN